MADICGLRVILVVRDNSWQSVLSTFSWPFPSLLHSVYVIVSRRTELTLSSTNKWTGNFNRQLQQAALFHNQQINQKF